MLTEDKQIKYRDQDGLLIGLAMGFINEERCFGGVLDRNMLEL